MLAPVRKGPRSVDTAYFPPVERVDGMPMMNRLSSSKQLEWGIRDDSTGEQLSVHAD
jgi:hypothetical protein